MIQTTRPWPWQCCVKHGVDTFPWLRFPHSASSPTVCPIARNTGLCSSFLCWTSLSTRFVALSADLELFIDQACCLFGHSGPVFIFQPDLFINVSSLVGLAAKLNPFINQDCCFINQNRSIYQPVFVSFLSQTGSVYQPELLLQCHVFMFVAHAHVCRIHATSSTRMPGMA